MKASKVVFLFSLIILFMFAASIQPVKPQSSGTIYIRSDGSVEGTDKIQRAGDVYKFSGNVSGAIYVQKDSIIVDGTGYTLQAAIERGIVLSGRKNVTIKNVNLIGGAYGIHLNHTTNSIISGNNLVSENDMPINLDWASNNTIEGNTVTGALYAVSIMQSYNNSFLGNQIRDNRVGLVLENCAHNVFRNNQMLNNSHSFSVRTYPNYDYVNDIDSSNTIDDAPIYYWVKEHDKTVPLDAGFVALINCTRIRVQNLNLRDGQGMLLVYTANSTIANNTVKSNGGSEGIGLVHSSNNEITGNKISGHSTGIELQSSSNNTIIGNDVFSNDRGIRPLYSSKYNIISRNFFANSYIAMDDIQTESATGNIISNNTVTGGDTGLALPAGNLIANNTLTGNTFAAIDPIGKNTITGNIVKNNRFGIFLSCSNNILRNNRLENNTCNFRIQGTFDNDVDSSNTVDGKPIYYWVNRQGGTVPSDAGFVVLVNCKNIIVQDLNLANHGDGIVLAFTTDSIVTRSVITNKEWGIIFYGSSHNRIVGNTIANCQQGIRFDGATIFSRYYASPNNLMCYNNFVNNQEQVYDLAVAGDPWHEDMYIAKNIWDYGYPSGGNYWSNYIGKDANGDGIGDTPYGINANNTDRYPLMYQVAISGIVVPPFPDLTSPTVTMISPANKTYATSDVPLTLNVNEDASWKAYSLDSQANVTIVENTVLTGLANGKHNVIAYAKDLSGNVGLSNKIYFTIDTIPPKIQILSIKNETIYTTDVKLNFALSEPISRLTYSLDSQANVTIDGNITLTGLSDGSHTLTIYAKDGVGNESSETIHFTVSSESSDSSLPIEYGYAIVSVIGVAIVAPIGYFVLKRRRARALNNQSLS